MYFINPNLYVIISPPDEKCGLIMLVYVGAILNINSWISTAGNKID